jgi:hypothetical protein
VWLDRFDGKNSLTLNQMMGFNLGDMPTHESACSARTADQLGDWLVDNIKFNAAFDPNDISVLSDMFAIALVPLGQCIAPIGTGTRFSERFTTVIVRGTALVGDYWRVDMPPGWIVYFAVVAVMDTATSWHAGLVSGVYNEVSTSRKVAEITREVRETTKQTVEVLTIWEIGVVEHSPYPTSETRGGHVNASMLDKSMRMTPSMPTVQMILYDVPRVVHGTTQHHSSAAASPPTGSGGFKGSTVEKTYIEGKWK